MTINLHDTTDAAVWAAEFCKRWPSALCQIPGREGVSDGRDFEGIMIGWFANAIMAGVDSEARKNVDPATIRAEALREALAVILPIAERNEMPGAREAWNAVSFLIDKEQDHG